MDLVTRIVNAIKADPNEGEDGEVYAALGYVRKGLRAGSRRRPRPVAGEQPAAPATTAEEVKTETKPS